MNLTAIIRCKPGHAEAVLEALNAVGAYARAEEPDTLGYRVVRSADDPNLFITQERFASRAAMDAHNNGAGSKAFFTATAGLLEGAEIYTGEEAFSL